jgi:serine/threonine-protein kinase
MIHCCRALHYAHSKGVIHRDIKSGNAMITRDKTLKIMDFGLAKFLTEYQNNHTQQVGTPFYMSPEQIIGKNIDFRSDLYSLGCTLFECATGTVPFFKGDLSYHHLHTKPPSPRSINPALTRDMEGIILKLLEKNPDDRYQSAKELIESVTTSAPPLT